MDSKKDQYFVDGTQEGGLVDRSSNRLMPWSFIMDYFRAAGPTLSKTEVRERFDRELKVQSSGRYRTARITVKMRTADKRYYKLHTGDILDIQSKTILDGETLKALLDD